MSKDFGCVGTTIRTVSGYYLDLENPDPSMITIHDIACGVANTCRFGGQVPPHLYYSVAEHSVECSDIARRDGDSIEVQIACLMHDAAEAFLGDVVKPLKIKLSDYDLFEKRMEEAICKRFNFEIEPYKAIVKEIDQAILIAEKRHLHPSDRTEWNGEKEIRKVKVVFHNYQPVLAYDVFMTYAKHYGVK